MKLRLISWNVNGTAKLSSFPSVLTFLTSASVIFLQETFEIPPANFSPPGFIRFGNDALATGGRPSRGSSCLFLQQKFAAGSFTEIDSGVDWLLIVRWVPQGSNQGVIFGNVYFPRYSPDALPTDFGHLKFTLSTLLNDFPSDGIVFGGDFNFNRFRVHSAPLDR